MDIIEIIAISLSASCLFISLITAALSAYCLIEYRAFRKSTHSIQYVPAEPSEPGLTKEQMESFDSDPYGEEL
jgi:hypothetical protein